MRARSVVWALSAVVALLGAACSSNVSSGSASGPTSSASATGAPGVGGTAIGFIFVGPKNDYGYNHAAYEGSQALKAAFPNLKVLTAANVPEDANPTPVMNHMLNERAKI